MIRRALVLLFILIAFGVFADDTIIVKGGSGSGSGDVTAVGNCTTADCGIEGGNDFFPFIYEGTANNNEITFNVTDPTGDRTITFPNETGTVCTTGSICTGYQGTVSGTANEITNTGGTLSIAST